MSEYYRLQYEAVVVSGNVVCGLYYHFIECASWAPKGARIILLPEAWLSLTLSQNITITLIRAKLLHRAIYSMQRAVLVWFAPPGFDNGSSHNAQ